MSGVSNKNMLDDFCIRFCSIIEKHCKYIIVSGFVAISSGRTRATEDIDMIIERLPLKKVKKLHSDLLKNGFVCMQSSSADEIFDYLMHNIAVRYTFKDKPLPQMEVKFAKDALDDYQLKTRAKIPSTGINVWFGSINMSIAFKEKALKSEKDLKDAEHLRTVYAEMVDEHEISEIKKMIRKLRL